MSVAYSEMDGLENEVDCDALRDYFAMPETASLPKNETQSMLWSCGMKCPDVCPDGKDRALDQLTENMLLQ